ncbi:MAG TPA: thioredoxin domain-containing protein [Longimicrobium sp.]|nr:thioredoxin domain-containing protein [Longimicrobium sp.]
MNERISNLFTGVLTVCAVVVTGMVVRREFFGPSAQPAPVVEVTVENWESFAASGGALGTAGAPVRIVEFSDFQCPYCAEVSTSLRRLRDRYPGRVSVVYRHYPLESIHPHAFAAAVAVECAGEQGRFEAFHDALFAVQDSIGLRPWSAYAAEAAVPDVAALVRCVEDERFAARVRADMDEARRAGVVATPAFIFNGKMVDGTAGAALVERWVEERLSQR